MRADHVPLISRDQVLIRVLIEINIEMIEPEIRHHLLQLALAVNRAHQLRLLQFVDHDVDRPRHGQKIFALVRRQLRQQTVALRSANVSHEQTALFDRHGNNRVHPFFFRKREDGVGLGGHAVLILLVDLCLGIRVRSISRAGQLVLLLPVGKHAHLHFINRPLHRIGRQSNLSVSRPLDQIVIRESLHQIVRRHPQCPELPKFSVRHAVADLFWMQLLLDPVVNVRIHHLLQTPRPRPKRQPVQRVQRPLLLGHLGRCGRTLRRSHTSRLGAGFRGYR